jgi:hypothetical protein
MTDLNLPPDFWESLPALKHVRDYAHSRRAAADPVLYGALARIAAFRPPGLALETGVLSPASLNYMTAVCVRSGGGKTTGSDIARCMLAWPQGTEDRELPFGSGEGMAEAYMGTAVIPTGQLNRDSTPKVTKIRMQVHHNALFTADEGKAFTELLARPGSTLGATVRSAWSGAVIGNANASAETTRLVSGYALGVYCGFQPASVGPLVNETAYGTSQRFMYCYGRDPRMPAENPQNPGIIEVRYPAVGKLLTVTGEISRFLHEYHTQVVQEKIHPEPGTEHDNLMRAKTAALLLLLENSVDRKGGTEVTTEHWRLAGVMLGTSKAVRAAMQEEAGLCEIAEQKKLGALTAARYVGTDDTYRAMTESKVTALHAEGKDPRDILLALSRKQRDVFPNVKDIRAFLKLDKPQQVIPPPPKL